MSAFLGVMRTENDPLIETYFARAADALDVHRADSGHACLSCAAAWPCAPALAAAFMLDLHTA
ncbi:hypothetical protein [Nonomuraea aurantiaca]|uniref:hypothetical protein n=1 Tax=Nonomuraea aurantiaca TaxID=2878562 RepID=UPI001CDA2F08|nr:hypothetical protein [Nonomuraea aurantiaca]MCA2229243.1 hypothetical protein [Nonomuraea aurantiaca]